MEPGAVMAFTRPERVLRGDVDALVRAGARAAPVTLAELQVLPVLPVLVELFPTGLRRGSALAVTGDAAVSMALALAAGPTASGAWAVALGVNGLGLGAAAGFGVAMERLVVADPGSAWPAVLGVAVDGFDVVIAQPPRGLAPSVWRRILARARERGGVVLAIDPPATLEVAATVSTSGVWSGVHDGAGVLRSRAVTASVGGRGALARVRRSALLLPGPDGAVAPVGHNAADPSPVDERAGAVGVGTEPSLLRQVV
jgi:hypothetical protein